MCSLLSDSSSTMKRVSCTRLGESENTLSIRKPQPQTTTQKKEEIEKILKDKKITRFANKKTLILLINQVVPSPSNSELH